jgi:hypothetical protein
MHTSGKLRIDPGTLESIAPGADIEIVVPYTEWSLAEAVLKRAAVLTAGLNVTIRLIAVHVLPYPLPFRCPASVHAHLVEQLVDLASQSPVAIEPQVVLARYQDEGFRHVLKPGSTVLIGAHRHFWRSREEKLAHTLADAGHEVALLHVD